MTASNGASGAAGDPFPAPSRKLRLGIVGGGRGSFIGPVHLNGARLSSRWDLVAAAPSSRPDVARASGRDLLLQDDRVHVDFRSMAEDEAARAGGIGAVAIVTPNATHHAVARAFMDRGIDVISDKPLTSTMADALDLVEAQRRTGLVFGVTYSFAGHAMVRQARQMVADGALGAVRQIHVEFFQEWAIAPASQGGKGAAWRLDEAQVGAAFTTGDIGTHAHHLAAFVSGLQMTQVRADFHVSGAPKPLEDTAFMHVRYAGGVPGTLMVSQVDARRSGRRSCRTACCAIPTWPMAHGAFGLLKQRPSLPREAASG